MTSAMPGCDVRRSDSVHPVHSWKCSQTTEGLSPLPAASTMCAAVDDDRPTAAAAMVQTLTKSRRETARGSSGTGRRDIVVLLLNLTNSPDRLLSNAGAGTTERGKCSNFSRFTCQLTVHAGKPTIRAGWHGARWRESGTNGCAGKESRANGGQHARCFVHPQRSREIPAVSSQLFATIVLAAVLLTYVGVAWRTWARLRGKRVVVCPATKQPAAVSVDVEHAVATALLGKTDLRLTACSRWPERGRCQQPCVNQIEIREFDTRPGTLAARFFATRRCAICQCLIEPLSALTLQPGFMDPATGRVEAWDEIEPQDLPGAIVTRRPLCSTCTLAESFRDRYPDEVAGRRVH